MSNGFFIQTPDARADASAETSNGIFVYTGAAPTVQVGDQVDVTATVAEFFNMTELTGADRHRRLVGQPAAGGGAPDPDCARRLRAVARPAVARQ